jgi:hypothetical protein
VATRWKEGGHQLEADANALMLTATNDKARVHPASPNRNVTVRDGTMAHVTLHRYVSQVAYARRGHEWAGRSPHHPTSGEALHCISPTAPSLDWRATDFAEQEALAHSTAFCFALIAPSLRAGGAQ